MDAVVLCGVQGAGKTTFYQQHFVHTHVRISLDVVRTRHRESVLLHACLALEQPFVVDNTNPLADTRSRYLRLARACGFRARLYWVESTLAESLARNAARERKVPPGAVAGTARSFEIPSLDEGWDEIHRVVVIPGGVFEVVAIRAVSAPT
jgi:predicted kinase